MHLQFLQLTWSWRRPWQHIAAASPGGSWGVPRSDKTQLNQWALNSSSSTLSGIQVNAGTKWTFTVFRVVSNVFHPIISECKTKSMPDCLHFILMSTLILVMALALMLRVWTLSIKPHTLSPTVSNMRLWRAPGSSNKALLVQLHYSG